MYGTILYFKNIFLGQFNLLYTKINFNLSYYLYLIQRYLYFIFICICSHLES